MNEQFGDARLEELKLLSELDRQGTMSFPAEMDKPRRDMLVELVHLRCVTDAEFSWTHQPDFYYTGLPGESVLERRQNEAYLKLLSQVLGQARISIEITHRGRVRLSELKQALRTGRERERFGILWDDRHWETDVQIAILAAKEESPLAVAFLDMNGLKHINDTYGHAVGDRALRTCFQAIASVLGESGSAYRLNTRADEVSVMLPNHDEDAAVAKIQLACTKLLNEPLRPEAPEVVVSIAAGVVTCIDPNASPETLKTAADHAQMKAKKECKKTGPPHPSVIAVEGKDELITVSAEVQNRTDGCPDKSH